MFSMTRACPADRQVLLNLFEKYDYEFSQYDLRDVNDEGLFAYEWIDTVLRDGPGCAYLVRVDGHLAGFVLVSPHADAPDRPCDLCLSEFFILYKYRRQGVGRRAVFETLKNHHGRWQLKYHPRNEGSARFWQRVIGESTSGRFELVENYPNPQCDYDDGSKASLMFFRS